MLTLCLGHLIQLHFLKLNFISENYDLNQRNIKHTILIL